MMAMRRRHDRCDGNERPRKGEATMSHWRSNEHADATMGSILTFRSRGIHAEPRVLPYGGWLTDARLSSLGFSPRDIRAIRRGEAVGRVLRRPIRFGFLAFEDDAMGRPDDCRGGQDRPEEVKGPSNSQPEEHLVSSREGNGQAIATPHPLDRVVLVPCSASSARQWKRLAEQLAGFDSVPLDLWGHGNQVRWRGTGPLSLAEQAAAIHEACPDGAPFHLVGHSYGGGVALRFALSHPERLRSLTLIEPSSFHILKSAEATDAHVLDEIRAVAEAVNRGVICGDYASGMQTFIDYWGGAGSWESLPDDKKVQFAQLAVHVAHHFWGLIEETTLLEAYAAIDVPTLILCGTRSPAPSRAITRLLAEALPCARHRTIRNAGHMSPITHPAEVNALVVEHALVNRAATSIHPPAIAAPDLAVGDRPRAAGET
jgi:pimeloyl-ACP methyl ester carboxylesterase